MNRVLLAIISFIFGVIFHKAAEDVFAWVVEKLKGYFDKDKDKVEEVKDAVVEAAKDAQDKAEEVVEEAVGAAKEVAEKASDALGK